MSQSSAAMIESLIGQRLSLDSHFDEPVLIEGIRPLGPGYEVRVRRGNGVLDETILSSSEIETLVGTLEPPSSSVTLVDPHHLHLLIESARIRLAYAHDRQFAVSLSGIRTLPHQIEAVYEKMLPQPRLRFLLADDPGAGKTIMTGLYIKEMKLRQAVERILILVPAPLTIQWQNELLNFFSETFQIIHSGNDQQQLINLWQRENQVIASIDYAKQPEVRERVWQPFDVSNLRDRCGFDIRSLGPPDPATGQRSVRRIEVKGRQRGKPVRLTINEWLKARQLRDSYWLYVVWEPTGPSHELVTLVDPGHRLEHAAREVRAVSHIEIPAVAISEAQIKR